MEINIKIKWNCNKFLKGFLKDIDNFFKKLGWYIK